MLYSFRLLLSLATGCSGQIAWPVQSFSPEVARMLQAALAAMPAADVPSRVVLGAQAPSALQSSPAISTQVPLSSPEGPREKLVPVVERPPQKVPLGAQQLSSPPTPTPQVPRPALGPLPAGPSAPFPPQQEPAATPFYNNVQTMPSPSQQAPAATPFYLTAATRLRLPSALYPPAVAVPFIPGGQAFPSAYPQPAQVSVVDAPTPLTYPYLPSPSNPAGMQPLPSVPAPTPQVAPPTMPAFPEQPTPDRTFFVAAGAVQGNLENPYPAQHTSLMDPNAV
ncbi:hypothetical protein Q1695_002630 [Nippostrongylus brasiliensis]|nr:hypothetical protein Q1695_002630 [Nippostrongylus brasiliensis]